MTSYRKELRNVVMIVSKEFGISVFTAYYKATSSVKYRFREQLNAKLYRALKKLAKTYRELR